MLVMQITSFNRSTFALDQNVKNTIAVHRPASIAVPTNHREPLQVFRSSLHRAHSHSCLA